MSTLSDPALGAAAVTPSDSTDLGAVRGLWVGGAGDVAIRTKNMASAVVLSAVPAGTLIPVRAKHVYSTGTTATLIVALY